MDAYDQFCNILKLENIKLFYTIYIVTGMKKKRKKGVNQLIVYQYLTVHLLKYYFYWHTLPLYVQLSSQPYIKFIGLK